MKSSTKRLVVANIKLLVANEPDCLGIANEIVCAERSKKIRSQSAPAEQLLIRYY